MKKKSRIPNIARGSKVLCVLLVYFWVYNFVIYMQRELCCCERERALFLGKTQMGQFTKITMTLECGACVYVYTTCKWFIIIAACGVNVTLYNIKPISSMNPRWWWILYVMANWVSGTSVRAT